MSQRRVTLGSEIRRLRGLSGTTLRRLASRLDISAAHLSDIERDKRRPSKQLLTKIANQLKAVGATNAGLDRLDSRFESDLQEWAAATPEVRLLLRKVKESRYSVSEVLKKLERTLRENGRVA